MNRFAPCFYVPLALSLLAAPLACSSDAADAGPMLQLGGRSLRVREMVAVRSQEGADAAGDPNAAPVDGDPVNDGSSVGSGPLVQIVLSDRRGLCALLQSGHSARGATLLALQLRRSVDGSRAPIDLGVYSQSEPAPGEPAAERDLLVGFSALDDSCSDTASGDDSLAVLQAELTLTALGDAAQPAEGSFSVQLAGAPNAPTTGTFTAVDCPLPTPTPDADAQSVCE